MYSINTSTESGSEIAPSAWIAECVTSSGGPARSSRMSGCVARESAYSANLEIDSKTVGKSGACSPSIAASSDARSTDEPPRRG